MSGFPVWVRLFRGWKPTLPCIHVKPSFWRRTTSTYRPSLTALLDRAERIRVLRNPILLDDAASSNGRLLSQQNLYAGCHFGFHDFHRRKVGETTEVDGSHSSAFLAFLASQITPGVIARIRVFRNDLDLPYLIWQHSRRSQALRLSTEGESATHSPHHGPETRKLPVISSCHVPMVLGRNYTTGRGQFVLKFVRVPGRL